MRITRNILLFFSMVMLFGCAKTDEDAQKNTMELTLPVASFYATGNEGPAPVEVYFHNTSQYSDTWEWTFHNGAKSNEFEPTFNYFNNTDEDKTYLVILKATDSGTGKSNTRSKTIVVHPSR